MLRNILFRPTLDAIQLYEIHLDSPLISVYLSTLSSSRDLALGLFSFLCNLHPQLDLISKKSSYD